MLFKNLRLLGTTRLGFQPPWRAAFDPIYLAICFIAKKVFNLSSIIYDAIDDLKENQEKLAKIPDSLINEKREELTKLYEEKEKFTENEQEKNYYKNCLNEILRKNENFRVEALKIGAPIDQAVDIHESKYRAMKELGMTPVQVRRFSSTDEIEKMLAENAGKNLQREANTSSSYVKRLPDIPLDIVKRYLGGSAANMTFFDRGYNQENQQVGEQKESDVAGLKKS